MSVEVADLENGGIYSIRNSHIRFPGSWIRPRQLRTVIVLSSDFVCQSPSCEVVSIAPMSTDLSLSHPTDIILRMSKDNGLNRDGRILLGHIQPAAKDLFNKKFGRVNNAEWHEIIMKIIDNLDR